MNLDGLTLSVLTNELQEHIQGGQIQRLLQIDKTSLYLKIRTAKKDEYLMITVGSAPACYISSPIKDVPKEPSSLCMFLRKHLETARITKVEQINSDRILCLSLDKLELDGRIANYKIYVELMGKYSNCIIVKEGVILESLIHVTPFMNRERTIEPKQTYELPPGSNRVSIFDFSQDELKNLLTMYQDHADTIGALIRYVFNGFGNLLLDEVCYRAQLNGSLAIKDQLDKEPLWAALAKSLYSLAQELKKATTLIQYQTAGNKLIYTPLPLQEAMERGYHIKEDNLSPSALIEGDIKRQGSLHTAGHNLAHLLEQAIKKEKNRNKKIKKELSDSSKADQYKEYGDLLMINAYQPCHYQKSITLDNVLVDPVVPITIPLKPELSLVENAQQYYKWYTKLKNRLISGQYQFNKSCQRIDYLDSILYSLSLAKDSKAVQEIKSECEQAGLIKKNHKPTPYKTDKKNFIRYPLASGALVIIGRNNAQNDYLTHRFARPNDLWFHTLHIQGSHVILQSPGQATDEDISLAAAYSAYYSNAKDSTHVPVDYTLVKNIKKPPASPLGYVTYTKQKTIIVDPIAPQTPE